MSRNRAALSLARPRRAGEPVKIRLLAVLLAALLALPLALSAPRAAEAGSPPLNWTYRDKVHKFSLKMFRDYEPVPQKTGEKVKACEFRDPKSKGQARGSFNTEVAVVRVSTDGKGGPVTTGGGEGGDGGGPMTPERMAELFEAATRPTNVWDATLGQLRLTPEMQAAVEEGKKEFKEIKSKDRPSIVGKLWQFSIPSWYDERWHITMAEYERDGIAYGIFMTCGEKLEKHFAKAFAKIAKSFQWFDKKAEEVETLDVLEGVRITARKRLEIERGMVDNWDVIISPKKNYVVLYNTKNGKNHELAKTIAKRIELIREQIYEEQFPPAQPIDTVCIVRVCADSNEYRSYGGPGGSAGYWSPGAEELVFYDASRTKKADKDTLSVLYHEAFHQYIHYSVGRVAPHSWFNEGHGDYYAGAEFKGGKFKIKPFQWRVGTVRNAIVQGPRSCEDVTGEDGKQRRQWGTTGFTPLKQLVAFSQGEYYSYPGVSYAQGWSLIYFLREIVPGNKKYNEKWGHILDLYFNTLKAEVNRDGSLDAERERRKQKEEEEKRKAEESEDDEDDETPPPPPATPDTPDTPGTPSTPGTPDTPDGEGEDEAATNEPPRTYFQGLGGAEALEKALQVAFEGVDWEDFQAAWLKATKHGK